MRILTSCHQCNQEGNTENASLLVIANDTTITSKCNNGHSQNVNIPKFKHELLFEIGIHAIKDGYYREAISTFSASLERYYEFVIRLLLTSHNSDAIEAAWKKVASQSERQVGAYIFCSLMFFNRTPETLAQKMIELRNNVIHKGEIPTEAEALKFGTNVSNLILAGYNSLKKSHGNEINEQMRRIMFPSNDESADKHFLIPTFIDITRDSERPSLDHYLTKVLTHNTRKF